MISESWCSMDSEISSLRNNKITTVVLVSLAPRYQTSARVSSALHARALGGLVRCQLTSLLRVLDAK
jgi:hypothetical protein